MDVKDKKVLIMGAARSGIAASKFLKTHGAGVILTDIKEAEKMIDVEKELVGSGIETLWGQQPDIKEIKPDFIVVSPGIPLTIAPLNIAAKLQIPVISELNWLIVFPVLHL